DSTRPPCTPPAPRAVPPSRLYTGGSCLLSGARGRTRSPFRGEGSGDEGARHRRTRTGMARDRDPPEQSRQAARLPSRTREETCRGDRLARRGCQAHPLTRTGDRIRGRRIGSRTSGPRGESRASRRVAAGPRAPVKLVTAVQMRALEQRAVEAGLSIPELMEAAGLAVAQEAWL